MDEVVTSVDKSLFEQTLMMALISKSSDFNVIFNLTAVFYFQTWRWSHAKIIHSSNIRIHYYNIPDAGNVWDCKPQVVYFKNWKCDFTKDISIPVYFAVNFCHCAVKFYNCESIQFIAFASWNFCWKMGYEGGWAIFW